MSEDSKMTQFKVGNEAWKARSSHGRNPLFANPEILWTACCEYFEWVNENPLQTVELVKYQGEAKQHQVPRMRPMTVDGLCNFLDISTSTWGNYKEKPDFLTITTRVESIIYQYKFEGAAAELLNPNIIARETGLSDKQKITHEGLPEVNIYLPENKRDNE